MKITKLMIIVLVSVFVFTGNAGLFAQEVKQDTKKETEKAKTSSIAREITGEVSAVDKNGIAVVYNRDLTKGTEEEVFVPLDKTVKLVHKQNIKDINVGDVVTVQFEEIGEETKEGVVRKFVGRMVTFVKPAVKKPEPAEITVEPEADNTL